MTLSMPDILEKYRNDINYAEVCRLRAEFKHRLDRPHWQKLRAVLARLPSGRLIRQRNGAMKLNCAGSVITVGDSGDLQDNERQDLLEAVELLIPWRKGPFSLFGIEIDAEWRSDRKWERIAPLIEPLGGKRLADVGCGNGYYMFRASASEPECVIGFDPSESFHFAYNLVQNFVSSPNLQHECLGIADTHLFPEFFDVILCLGVLYHQRNPLCLLRILRSALKPGGILIVESHAIPGDQAICLFPPGRYAKARNVYFVPTAVCLAAWLERSGFKDAEVCSTVQLSTDEQRRTPFMPFESLADFLHSEDPQLTVEGHPAPLRVVVRGRKG